MTPAAQYIRVSSDQQRHSLSAQSAQIAAFAAERGYEVIRSYEDCGRSGLRLRGRPALQSLLADILSGAAGFELVLVQDVSRWGRFQDPDEAAHYEYLCRAAGVEVRYCSESFDEMAGRVGDIVKIMKRQMAADFSRDLSEKVRAAQYQHAKNGNKMGGVAGYGLRRAIVDDAGRIKAVLEAGQQRLLRGDRVRFVQGPADEVETVRRIFRMFLENGAGLNTIAEQLNLEGIAGERGRVWSSWTIGHILDNPKYAGVYRFGRRRRTLEGRRLDNTPDRILEIAGACDSIVPYEWLLAAAARRRTRMLFLPRWEILHRLRAHAARTGSIDRAAVRSCAELPSLRTCALHLGPWSRVRSRLGLYPFLPGQIDKRGALHEGARVSPEEPPMESTYTAFVGTSRLAMGDLETVAIAAHEAQDRQPEMPIVFDDATGNVVDLDLRGAPQDVIRRLRPAEPPQADAPRSRGRPKLGVTAREVTLLPKHWAWLQEQPGGASAALRRLVEQARQENAEADQRRKAQTATYRVMYALAGHLGGYEDALRALYAGDVARFETFVDNWPVDVATYVRQLASAAL